LTASATASPLSLPSSRRWGLPLSPADASVRHESSLVLLTTRDQDKLPRVAVSALFSC